MVNIKTVILYTIARMQAWRRLRHWSMPSSITLCYTPTHASNRCRLKSFTSCAFCGRLAAQDFVTKCVEARAVRWPEVWKFYGSLTLLHMPTGGANDAHNVSVDTAHRKENDQQNLYKNDSDIAGYIARSLQMPEDTIILFISPWRAMNKL